MVRHWTFSSAAIGPALLAHGLRVHGLSVASAAIGPALLAHGLRVHGLSVGVSEDGGSVGGAAGSVTAHGPFAPAGSFRGCASEAPPEGKRRSWLKDGDALRAAFHSAAGGVEHRRWPRVEGPGRRTLVEQQQLLPGMTRLDQDLTPKAGVEGRRALVEQQLPGMMMTFDQDPTPNFTSPNSRAAPNLLVTEWSSSGPGPPTGTREARYGASVPLRPPWRDRENCACERCAERCGASEEYYVDHDHHPDGEDGACSNIRTGRSRGLLAPLHHGHPAACPTLDVAGAGKKDAGVLEKTARTRDPQDFLSPGKTRGGLEAERGFLEHSRGARLRTDPRDFLLEKTRGGQEVGTELAQQFAGGAAPRENDALEKTRSGQEVGTTTEVAQQSAGGHDSLAKDPRSGLYIMTKEYVKAHNTADNCLVWATYEHPSAMSLLPRLPVYVYDLSNFVSHPGGAAHFQRCGGDASYDFSQHPRSALHAWRQRRVGIILPVSSAPSSTPCSAAPWLSGAPWKRLRAAALGDCSCLPWAPWLRGARNNLQDGNNPQAGAPLCPLGPAAAQGGTSSFVQSEAQGNVAAGAGTTSRARHQRRRPGRHG